MRSDGEIRVYHVGGPLRRYMAWLIFGPFTALMALAGALSTGGDQAGGWIVAGFFALVGMGVHWLVSRARLEVSAEGLKLRQTGYTLETPWSKVESLRMDKGHEGFVTREPMTSRGAELLASMRGVAFGIGRMPIYDSTARELLYQRRYIPIEAFAWHVRHGQLSDDLKRLAPHVQISSSVATPKAKPTPQQQRKDRIAVALVFGFTGLVLVAAFFIPRTASRHFIPAIWAVVATYFALQCGRLVRVAIRSGPKWMAILYILLAIVIGLWSFALWVEAITGKAPSKHAEHSSAANSPEGYVHDSLQVRKQADPKRVC